MISEKEFTARSEANREIAFKAFMESPPIRLLISMIPEGAHPETLKTLLTEAHKQGWNGGSTSLALMMFEKTLRER